MEVKVLILEARGLIKADGYYYVISSADRKTGSFVNSNNCLSSKVNLFKIQIKSEKINIQIKFYFFYIRLVQVLHGMTT